MKAAGTFEIDGFVIVLEHVRNVYPIERSRAGTYVFAFKFVDGFYEEFHHGQRKHADSIRKKFLAALSAYRDRL